MNKYLGRFILMVVVAFSLSPLQAQTQNAQTQNAQTQTTQTQTAWAQQWLDQQRAEHYLAATPEQLQQAQQELAQLLKHGLDEHSEADWQALGFRVQKLELAGLNFYALSEHSSSLGGKGAYLFPADRPIRTVIQAPHRFYDRFSGDLVLQLVLSQPGLAGMWNTASRRQIDLGQTKNSFFASFTAQLMRQSGQLRVLQMHGFDPDKRTSMAGRRAELILSAGATAPERSHYQAVACLRREVFKSTLLYPDDVKELGGTLNFVNALRRSHPETVFFHLEISAASRQTLRGNDAQLRQLYQCLN